MPEISDADLAKYKAAEESTAKLEAKNKELLEEKKTVQAAKDAAEKLAKEKEIEAAKAAGDYKTLAEKLDADRVAREAQDKERSEKFAKGAKLSKIQEELGKIGLDPLAVTHALKLVDLNEVKYDEGTNLVIGADVVASKLKVSLPQLFVKKDHEKMHHDPANSGGAVEMTVEWYNGLNAADKAKHYKAFMTSQGHPVR